MAINNISSQNLGKLLQIVFAAGVRNQLSENYKEWEMIQRLRVGDAAGREHRFYIQTSYGPAKVQYAAIASPGAFPAAQQSSSSEKTALFKEILATVELEYNLYERALVTPQKYAEPLANEIEAALTAYKRRLSADLFADGTGVIGECADVSAQVDFTTGTAVVITLDSDNTARGFTGWFEEGDRIQFYDVDGTEHALVDGAVSASYGLVSSKDRTNNQVTVAFYDSSDNLLTIDGLGTVTDTDVIYRKPQPTKADLTAISTTDYNTLCEVVPGLETLSAADGRVIHGITMSGVTAGSRYDAGGNPLDVSHIQKSLSLAKTRVGHGRYSYKSMIMAPEANDAFIESREVDRRFNSVADNKRGVNKFMYQHDNDALEIVVSEFCPKNRIYMLPEAKSGKKVVEFHGSDMKQVKVGGQSEFLKPSSAGGYERFMQQFLQGIMTLIVKHPAAINVVHNFTL